MLCDRLFSGTYSNLPKLIALHTAQNNWNQVPICLQCVVCATTLKLIHNPNLGIILLSEKIILPSTIQVIFKRKYNVLHNRDNKVVKLIVHDE